MFKNWLIIRRIVGHSMEPTFQDGQVVVATNLKKFAVGDVVIAQNREKEIIKRVVMVDGNWVRLAGDNVHDSMDVDTTTEAIRATLLIR